MTAATRTDGSRPRVLVIVLAEATLDLVEPWARAGRLPAFARLMAEGTSGPLRSALPLVTPQMIGTLVTGKDAGRHGLFDFWQRGADGRFREVHAGNLQEPPLWRLLERRGLRSGVVNVPITYPPEPIAGFMIAGQDAPAADRSIATPPELFDQLVGRFGPYQVKDIFPGGRRKQDYLALIEDNVRWQTDVLAHLVARPDWDFLLAFYSATAMAQHYFWADMEDEDASNPYRDVIERTYVALDEAIARLMHAAGPDVQVFVMSECGAGRLQSGVQLNTLLEKEGFLVRKRGASKHLASGRQVGALRRAVKRYMPARLRGWASRRLPGLLGALEARESLGSVDWARSRAYARGKEGAIFVNLQGREPHGIVAAGDEYHRVRAGLKERLAALIDPATGLRAVERVFYPEELYAGPMLQHAPDLVIAWHDTAYIPTEEETVPDAVFVPRRRAGMSWPTTGSHRRDGMLLCAGPGIGRGARIEGARLVDLAPTWFACLGQQPEPDFSGRVLNELFLS
jgi:predicted AlkP superfamily phosphohydrolase/phosphomutase